MTDNQKIRLQLRQLQSILTAPETFEVFKFWWGHQCEGRFFSSLKKKPMQGISISKDNKYLTVSPIFSSEWKIQDGKAFLSVFAENPTAVPNLGLINGHSTMKCPNFPITAPFFGYIWEKQVYASLKPILESSKKSELTVDRTLYGAGKVIRIPILRRGKPTVFISPHEENAVGNVYHGFRELCYTEKEKCFSTVSTTRKDIFAASNFSSDGNKVISFVSIYSRYIVMESAKDIFGVSEGFETDFQKLQNYQNSGGVKPLAEKYELKLFLIPEDGKRFARCCWCEQKEHDEFLSMHSDLSIKLLESSLPNSRNELVVRTICKHLQKLLYTRERTNVLAVVMPYTYLPLL